MLDISVNIQNFGKIKNAYNALLAEGILRKDDSKKASFAKYLKLVKENEILKLQFLAYTNIESKIEADRYKATNFVDETIDLFSKFTKKDIVKANKLLAENIVINDIADDLSELHESISTLIMLDKKPENIDTRVDAKSKIVEYILNNKQRVVTEAIELPSKLIMTRLVDWFNEKYSDINESDKEIIKALINSSDEKKLEVYSNTIRECITLIDENFEKVDITAKEKMLKVKDKLLQDAKVINEDFFKNISKLVELRDNLKNN